MYLEFEKAAKSDSTMTAGATLMMSMEKFNDDLSERNVTKDITADPTASSGLSATAAPTSGLVRARAWVQARAQA